MQKDVSLLIDETLATHGTGNDATPNTNGIVTQVCFAWHVSRLIIFTHSVCVHYDKSISLSPRSLLFKRPPRLWQRMKKGIVLCPTSRESRHRFVLSDILVLYLSLLILCVCLSWQIHFTQHCEPVLAELEPLPTHQDENVLSSLSNTVRTPEKVCLRCYSLRCTIFTYLICVSCAKSLISLFWWRQIPGHMNR